MSRPAVSVVLPFLGPVDEGEAALRELESLCTGPGDELLLVDNSPEGRLAGIAAGRVRIVHAGDRKSAAHARNEGARAAGGEWLLFVDADCALPADLIDRYFASPPEDGCAVVAGEVTGAADQRAFLARWARSRRARWVEPLARAEPPAGVTANMLVRRRAWQELGGFRVGGGGDLDLCWRAQAAGWSLAYRPDVVVEHRDRERLRELWEQAVSYGSHRRRLRELYGSERVPPVRLSAPLARALGGVAAHGARGRFERAAFSAVDAAWAVGYWWGDRTRGRRARRAD